MIFSDENQQSTTKNGNQQMSVRVCVYMQDMQALNDNFVLFFSFLLNQ